MYGVGFTDVHQVQYSQKPQYSINLGLLFSKVMALF